MDFGRDERGSQLGRNLLVIWVGLVVLVAVACVIVFGTKTFETEIPELVWLGAAVLLWVTVLLTLQKTIRIFEAVEDNSIRLERIAENLKKNVSILAEIAQSVRVSDDAKALAFGDAERQLLRQAVLDLVEQQDFATAFEMIDEIAQRPGRRDFAEQLRHEVNKRCETASLGQMKQGIAEIEQFLQSHDWARASIEIEKLIKAYPRSEEVRTLRQRLLDKTAQRKKILLEAWNDAVQYKATDRSLEILIELDQYLTPNEGLALQEAAKDVFKTKLHNLGVQFSIAVSDKNWAKAIDLGRKLMRDFPNSQMAKEIREKMDALRQNVEQERSAG
jgi:hypothetical protein